MTLNNFCLLSSFWPKNGFLKWNIHPYSPDLAPNDFWLFTKIKSALEGRRFQDIKDIKKCDDGTENYSTRVARPVKCFGHAGIGDYWVFTEVSGSGESTWKAATWNTGECKII
jgi:hypothetical protein